jgi:hypothetical protein
MGMPILILGESGTGKTTSLRNFNEGEIALVNVTGKALPFRGNFEMLKSTTDASKILGFMRETKAKRIIIDDCQYIMSFQYMRRIKENGWEKFNELQSDFFNIIDAVSSLPDDVVVYFLSHLETKDDGRQKIKTIGKMLDEKITIEGMFTTVLKTHVSDGKYYFLTQNSGSDTVKSPLGMFADFAIDNDLKYVDEKIRNYYRIGEYRSDEEIAKADEAAARPEIEKGNGGRVRRAARPKPAGASGEAVDRVGQLKAKFNAPAEETAEETAETPTEESKAEKMVRRTRKVRVAAPVADIDDEDLPFTMNN